MFNIETLILTGGGLNGISYIGALKRIKDDSIVMVHDAVRPFIKSSEIKTMISSFGEMDEDIWIFGIPVYESLKQIDKEDDLNEVIDWKNSDFQKNGTSNT